MLRIKRARPMDGFWVELTLSDGTRIERDLENLLHGPVFELIRADPAHFRQLRVRHQTLEWPDDIDLDPAVLIWDGPRPRDLSARPERRLVLRDPSVAPAPA
jgi:Protein of unknown function (DUF2442).